MEAENEGRRRGRGRGRGRVRGRGRPRGGDQERQEAPPSPPPPPPPHRRDIEDLFLKRNPPTFNGSGNPSDAELWVRAIERIFQLLRCTDEERLSCIAFQLTGPADFWWEARKKIIPEEHLAQYTWNEFKEALFDKYVPKTYRAKKESEFYNLKQGKMSVTEYDGIFCELARYAPDQVDTDEKMAKKFRSGLRHEIGVSLASHGGLSYTESLERALEMEAVMPEERRAPVSVPVQAQAQTQNHFNNNYKGKRKWEGGNNSGYYQHNNRQGNQGGNQRGFQQPNQNINQNNNIGKRPWQGNNQSGQWQGQGRQNAPNQ